MLGSLACTLLFIYKTIVCPLQHCLRTGRPVGGSAEGRAWGMTPHSPLPTPHQTPSRNDWKKKRKKIQAKDSDVTSRFILTRLRLYLGASYHSSMYSDRRTNSTFLHQQAMTLQRISRGIEYQGNGSIGDGRSVVGNEMIS